MVIPTKGYIEARALFIMLHGQFSLYNNKPQEKNTNATQRGANNMFDFWVNCPLKQNESTEFIAKLKR